MGDPARQADTTMVAVAGGASVCAQAIGDPAAPALVLLGGNGWSMDWWEDGFCDLLVAGGRRVVRFDWRDTGASTTSPGGEPSYTVADMRADVLAVLDAFEIERAHVVGLSMGGGYAQELALDHPERVATLTLMSTAAVESTGEDLPGPTPELQAWFADPPPEPDWSDRQAVIDHLVEELRHYAAPGAFDTPRMTELVRRVVDRSSDMAATLTNHMQLDDGPAPSRSRRLADLADTPTLVLHGTGDPLFPPAHGRALAAAIPGARFAEIGDTGHELPPTAQWERVTGLLLEHTA